MEEEGKRRRGELVEERRVLAAMEIERRGTADERVR